MKVSEYISQLIPYVPGKPIEETKRQYGISKVYKLASNENPLGPSPRAFQAIQQSLNLLNLYPDGSCHDLRKKVSAHFNFPEDGLVFGNGSDELVDFLVRVYCEAGDKILTSHRAFDTYRLSAQASRCDTTLIPMTSEFKFDLQAIQKAWTPEHKIIFITNPNNPTGTYSTKTEMDSFMEFFGGREDVIVVIDEAYFEFVRANDYPDSHEYTRKYENVVTLRTLSKVYGLAGLRLGMMFSSREIASHVNKVRKPFNINSLMQVAGIAALDDREFVKKTCDLVWSGLDYFYSEFKKMGIDYVPSQGNFVLFDTGKDSLEVYEKLLSKGFILRPVRNYGLTQHLRMSVGLQNENVAAIAALSEVLKS